MRDEDRLQDTQKGQVPYPKNTRLAVLIAVIALIVAGLIYAVYALSTQGGV